MFQSERYREMRRGAAIRAYVGPNGGGKSMCAVFDLMPSLQAGRPVLSTARLLDFEHPRPCEDEACQWPGHPRHPAAHPAWVPFTDWRQLLEFEHGDVLLDEVAGVASSRAGGSLPFQVARELQKLRKRDVTLSYTGPSFQRCELIIRECTLLLTHCSGRLARRLRAADGSARAWVEHRAVKWQTYDAQEFERFTSSDAAQLEGARKRVIRRKYSQFFRLASHPVLDAYDTHDAVLSLGWANDSGMCMECGGRRSVPRCDCGEIGRPRRSGRAVDAGGSPASAQREDDPPAPRHGRSSVAFGLASST